MGIPASLFAPPIHHIAQKKREVKEWYSVRISPRQDLQRPSGTVAQKAGMRYENRIGEELAKLAKPLGADLYSHIWIEADGRYYQPDYFMIFPSKSVLLFEVKQTWVDTTDQLNLYRSLLEAVGLGPVMACTICLRLTGATPIASLVHSFDEIAEGSVWQVRV